MPLISILHFSYLHCFKAQSSIILLTTTTLAALSSIMTVSDQNSARPAATARPQEDETTNLHERVHDASSEIPDRFVCPLTLELMKQPLYSKYGHSFERKAILQWLSTNDTCPVTRKPLSPSLLIPNNQLKSQIANWSANNIYTTQSDPTPTAFNVTQASAIASGVSLMSLSLGNEHDIAMIRGNPECCPSAIILSS